MILKINNVEQLFDYSNYNVAQLILEDPEMFYKTTNNIIKQVDGGVQECFLYEQERDLDLSKNTEILSDFYNFSCNSKKKQFFSTKENIAIV